jgi:hypothetical protein
VFCFLNSLCYSGDFFVGMFVCVLDISKEHILVSLSVCKPCRSVMRCSVFLCCICSVIGRFILLLLLDAPDDGRMRPKRVVHAKAWCGYTRILWTA